jgi:hypothetical protein
MSKDINVEKVDSLTVEIMALNREYILRVNSTDGKNNPVLVKAYFRKLFADWQKTMEKTIKEIESL